MIIQINRKITYSIVLFFSIFVFSSDAICHTGGFGQLFALTIVILFFSIMIAVIGGFFKLLIFRMQKKSGNHFHGKKVYTGLIVETILLSVIFYLSIILLMKWNVKFSIIDSPAKVSCLISILLIKIYSLNPHLLPVFICFTLSMPFYCFLTAPLQRKFYQVQYMKRPFGFFSLISMPLSICVLIAFAAVFTPLKNIGMTKSDYEKSRFIDNLLIKSSSLGLPDLTRALIEKGANVNYKTQKNHTPLLAAVFGSYYGKKYETLKVLIDHGANIDARYYDGSPLIVVLAQRDMSDLLDFFIENGADRTLTDKNGKNYLDYISKKKNINKLNRYTTVRLKK